MKELQGNQFDALIAASLYRNISMDAESFLSLDVSEIKDNPHLRSKILSKAMRGERTSILSALRIAVVACLIIASMLFTACMCIPEVRKSMWKAFTEWYDDHISIRFTTSDDRNQDNCENNDLPNETKEPPTSIEKRAVATYLPKGCYAEINEAISMYTDIFYYDNEGNIKFRLMQSIFREESDDDFMVDNENDPVTDMYINGYKGILVEYPDVPNTYYLAWQDESYQYWMYGSFSSVWELVKIAEGIALE